MGQNPIFFILLYCKPAYSTAKLLKLFAPNRKTRIRKKNNSSEPLLNKPQLQKMITKSRKKNSKLSSPLKHPFAMQLTSLYLAEFLSLFRKMQGSTGF